MDIYVTVDDLSMLFTTTPVLHRVLAVNYSFKQSIILAVVLALGLMALAGYHVIADELIVHSLSFVASIAVIGVRTIQLVNVRTAEGSAARREIWGIVRFGASQYRHCNLFLATNDYFSHLPYGLCCMDH
jgi:dihydroceramidase